MNLDLFDETDTVNTEQKELVRSLLNFAAKKLDLPDNTEVSVTFVTNPRIQEINREYREKDQATDVISFALEDDVEGEPDFFLGDFEGLVPKSLGDIIISIDRTKEQAEEYGHSFQRELGFLALHGFLHLNGYDHMNDEDEKEMFGLQKEMLEEYGLGRE